MATRTGYVGTQVAGDVLTAANFTKLPNGWIGYVEATANQNGISAETDLTSLTVSPTVGTSRRLRISGRVYVQVSSAGATAILRLKQDGVTIGQGAAQPNDTVDFVSIEVWSVETPSSGSHTYKLTLQAEAGTVDAENATSKGMVLVEDVGPAS